VPDRPTTEVVPEAVLTALAPDASPTTVEWTPLTGGTGAASAAVTRGRLEFDDGSVRTLVVKVLQPLREGRHAVAARSREHWAWWRRELHAYTSGLLPDGETLRAPRCYLATADTLYLEDLDSEPEAPHVAAARWGHWQASTPVPQADWLSRSQLAQRLSVSDLVWDTVDVDPRVVRLWNRRTELLDRFRRLPEVPSHGDFGPGNLHRVGATTVVSDWATFGTAPVGADLAHLCLGDGPLDVLDDHLQGIDGRFHADDVQQGFRINLVLTGAGRVHWMSERGIPVPDWYVPFLWDNRP
jgi:hypothetical protein